MLFNSIPFVLSFLIFCLFYFNFNLKYQNISLFLYGMYFYSIWNWKMSFLILFSILVNYVLAIKLDSKDDQSRRLFLKLGIVFNLLILGVFKYTLFVLGVFEDFINTFESEFRIWKPEILLPVGVSFYTFHNISYLVEVYKKNILACKSFLDFAIYDLFFPLLLAGPIERPGSLIPQIQNRREINRKQIYDGLTLFCFGIFLKATIADPLAKYVDFHLSRLSELPGGILWFVAPGFAFQVYADFFGYSLCAIGLSEIIGFRLMNNFKRPFFSTNPAEFWTRWHISLSSWLRDYVYIPLGGNRIGFLRQNLNIMIVWLLGGLWHGATYGYLVWGLYLGFCIVLYRVMKRWFDIPAIASRYASPIPNLVSFFGSLFTFFSFSFGLLLFRVSGSEELVTIKNNLLAISQFQTYYLYAFIFALPIFCFDIWQERIQADRPSFVNYLTFWQIGILFLVLILLFSLVSPFEKQEFFYFQF